MIIKNLQKLTTIDYPGKLACTIFIFGCNLRCSFCHNPSLIFKKDNIEIKKEEVLDFLRKRIKYLDGVCFTGGEPLATLDLEFVSEIKKLGYKIKIDTNGTYPEKLKQLIDLNLIDYIAMDIKTSKDKYENLTKFKNLNKIEESIRLISNFKDYEFRTTIIPTYHTIENIHQIKDWLLSISGKTKLKSYFIQSFISRPGNMISNEFDCINSPSDMFLNEIKELMHPFFEVCKIRN